jgi:hypothetical protein
MNEGSWFGCLSLVVVDKASTHATSDCSTRACTTMCALRVFGVARIMWQCMPTHMALQQVSKIRLDKNGRQINKFEERAKPLQHATEETHEGPAASAVRPS